MSVTDVLIVFTARIYKYEYTILMKNSETKEFTRNRLYKIISCLQKLQLNTVLLKNTFKLSHSADLCQ
jgi:hypothetical protein